MTPPLSEQEMDDLLGAYALGALADADMKRVEEHLAGCDRHSREAASLARVVPALALAVDDREPSPELRARVLSAALAPESPPPLPGEPAIPLPRVRGRVREGVPRRWQSVIAAAAAVVLIVGGFAFGRLTAPQPAPPSVVSFTFHGNASAPRAVARIDYFRGEHRAVVEITGLTALPSGQVYEMWLFKGAKPEDAGIAQAPKGTLVAQLVDLAGFSQFAVTVEPGEKPAPTTTPILIGKLS